MLKKNIDILLIILITFFSFFLRFYNLENLPGAFFTDEAALGYNGWSLMTTMRDEYGDFMPLTMRSFDDYKPAIYSYLTIPSIAISGLNQASSRAPAAFFGAILPLILFLIIKKLTKNKSLALLSALVVSITPWHIEISRTAIEAGVALTLTALSLWLFTSKEKQKKKHFLGLFLLVITLFTYHTARVISPIIILSAVLFKLIKPPKIAKGLLVIVAITGVTLSLTASSSRFGQISIFSDQESKLLREEAIREDGGAIETNLITTRLVHNKPLSIMRAFSKSYITNTSLSYLFLGGAQPPRVTIPETGQFLLILLPFFFLGIFDSIRKFKKFDQWLIFWLFFSPIPASLTTAEIPHTYRTLFMLLPISIFIAQGIIFSVDLIKKIKLPINNNYLKYPFVLFISFVIGFSFFKAWHQYSVHQQVHQPWHRQYGYKDLIKYLNEVPNKEIVTITNRENEPYMMILFYNKIDPKIYQELPQKRLGHNSIDSGQKTWQMFNYVFSEEACPHNLEDTNENNYYVAMFTCEVPEGFVRVKTINYLDGNPEFHIDRPMNKIEKEKL